MFLSEWREFPSAPCLARKKKTRWQLASRCCWNRAHPWHASELVSFLIGLRIYQHPSIMMMHSYKTPKQNTVFLRNLMSELSANFVHLHIFTSTLVSSKMNRISDALGLSRLKCKTNMAIWVGCVCTLPSWVPDPTHEKRKLVMTREFSWFPSVLYCSAG